MKPQITSLHHVTATVTEAQPDLDFYVGHLGLRLVKTTINFDNPEVYHLYYGDERGTPSTLMTTFPYGGWGVPPGVRGVGQIHVTSFSVPVGSLDFWRDRLTSRGLGIAAEEERFGAPSLTVADPSGLQIELIEASDDPRAPWIGGEVGADAAIRGIHGVTLLHRESQPTREFLTEVLGFRVSEETGARTRVSVGEGGPGATVELLRVPTGARAQNGLGTVHHVAFAVADDEEQLRIREILLKAGVSVTEVRDRQYFRSIYFREPGGVLFEIATAGPGFLVDEEPGLLGSALKLPPWEEARREWIQDRLPPLARS